MNSLLPLIAAASALAQEPGSNPLVKDPKASEAGRGIFRIYCSPCHGLTAKGGRGPDLTRGVFSVGETDADLFRVIASGAQGTEMPGFAERFDPENIWKLVSYIRSTEVRETGPPAGDAARGEKLYWGKGGCGACHRIGTRGGRLGPDLTRTGRERSRAYLKESIISPDADLPPGYSKVIVVTKEGRKIEGVQRGFDNFSAQLMDLSETFHSFFREEVKSIQREFRSVMPGDYAKRLTPAEIDDLVAYLTTLRGGK